ncbi:MAG: hypothetical protein PHV39_02380 [Methanomicrobium sp.]|nr:hypothetical protein [Methanomicrobium sp.]
MAITGKDILAGISCGDAVSFGNMAVAPLLHNADVSKGPEYLILREAFEKEVLQVTEISESGSVPELAVRNTGKIPVLILDGEELTGAKQNRVVNASILVPPEAKIIVPVSCTEAGRWTYRSANFSDSDLMMSRNIRAKKSRSVSENLGRDSGFRSDQSEVWNEIEMEARAYGVNSPTAAMKDTHEKHRDRMEKYIDAFKLVEGQAGCLVFLNGSLAGCELLSRPEKYSMLHQKIIRSYVIDALREKQKTKSRTPQKEFERAISDIGMFKADCFPSVGLGEDCRIRENNVAGSALRYEEKTIHATVFWLDEQNQHTNNCDADKFRDEHMSSFRERRHRMNL